MEQISVLLAVFALSLIYAIYRLSRRSSQGAGKLNVPLKTLFRVALLLSRFKMFAANILSKTNVARSDNVRSAIEESELSRVRQKPQDNITSVLSDKSVECDYQSVLRYLFGYKIDIVKELVWFDSFCRYFKVSAPVLSTIGLSSAIHASFHVTAIDSKEHKDVAFRHLSNVLGREFTVSMRLHTYDSVDYFAVGSYHVSTIRSRTGIDEFSTVPNLLYEKVEDLRSLIEFEQALHEKPKEMKGLIVLFDEMLLKLLPVNEFS
jgi:hypothetical protein